MKKILGVVVILAAIVLGGYYGMGFMTERTLKKNIEGLNQSNGLVVEVAQYHRHWFSSDAVIKAQLHIAEHTVDAPDGHPTVVPAEDLTMDFPVDIHHGPIINTGSGLAFGLGYAKVHLTLPQALVDKFSTIFDDRSTKPVVDATLFVGYNNKSRISLSIPTFKLFSKEGKGEVTWLGMDGRIAVSSDNQRINGNFVFNGINMVKDQMSAILGKVTSQYDLQKTKDGLYLGEAGVNLPLIDVTQDKTKLFELNEFNAHSESNIVDGLFSTTLKSSLVKLMVNDTEYGPGAFEVAIKNIDAKVLATINGQVNKMKQSVGTDRQQVMLAMIPEFPKLFSKGAILQISTLKLNVPEGQIDGQFELSLPKEDISPFQIMQKIEGSGKFQVPTAIVKRVLSESIQQKAAAQTSLQNAMMAQMQNDKTGAMPTAPMPQLTNKLPATPKVDPVQKANDEADKKLAALVQANVLNQQGENYVVEFKLTQGNFTVNGHPFDPASLKL